MIHHLWRLSEGDRDNLGLSCSQDGLVLGRTPLLERQYGRFVVRESGEIQRLLGRAYRSDVPIDRIMFGLANVAAALNANDPCLAAIAAVHLRIPDLPDASARDRMEAEDRFLKYARDASLAPNWDPAKHPRTGMPPNPGWFAPTNGDGAESATRIAENEDKERASDAVPSLGDQWVRLPPGKRIDELGDFLEWLANAKPQDEQTIRAEIKRYYYDVGDTAGGDALNRALSDVLDPGISQEQRQEILNSIEPYARSDPAEVARFREAVILGSTLLPGRAPAAGVELSVAESEVAAAETASEAWKLGWAARGQYFDKLLRDGSLPLGFRTIDNFTSGIATSIKSIDLSAATYQQATRLTNRLSKYVSEVSEYEGGSFAGKTVLDEEIAGRALKLVVPKGRMSEEQRMAIDAVRNWAKSLNRPVELILVPL